MILQYYVNSLLKNKNWSLVRDKENHITYIFDLDNSILIDVEMKNNKVNVCVPLKNSMCQYKTSFSSEMSAYDYLEEYMLEYYNYGI
jgi:hypothetical protein